MPTMIQISGDLLKRNPQLLDNLPGISVTEKTPTIPRLWPALFQRGPLGRVSL